MRRTTTAGVIAGLMIAGLAGIAGAGETICPKLEISSIERPNDFDSRKFSAVETTDVVVHVVLPQDFKEEHVVSLKFYTPRGHLYRQMDVPVSAKIGSRDVESRKLPGYPYPVTVENPQVRRVAGETAPEVQVRFPVGGTSIVTSSLYGMWRVVALIDGVEQRCVRPLNFGIGE